MPKKGTPSTGQGGKAKASKTTKPAARESSSKSAFKPASNTKTKPQTKPKTQSSSATATASKSKPRLPVGQPVEVAAQPTPPAPAPTPPPPRMLAPPAPTLRERYQAVRQRIADAAIRAGRKPERVHLVAVTKYASPDQIRSLIDLGHIDLGESRVQQLTQRAPLMHEYLQRQRALGGADRGDGVSPPEKIRWHMIGSLQRNKVKAVLPHVQLVHSVDSLRLAEEIHAVAAKLDICVDVLLQVNISGETSKSGVASPAALHLIDQMDTMVHLRPRGLMTMAPKLEGRDESGAVRSVFSRCRECFEEIRSQGVGGKDFNVLSMGMTDDFDIAVEEGANVIRVGRAIFGDQEG